MLLTVRLPSDVTQTMLPPLEVRERFIRLALGGRGRSAASDASQAPAQGKRVCAGQAGEPMRTAVRKSGRAAQVLMPVPSCAAALEPSEAWQGTHECCGLLVRHPVHAIVNANNVNRRI